MVRRLVATLLLAVVPACEAAAPPEARVHAFRLLPGQDLKSTIQRYADEHHIEAGWIASCAGSLTAYCLRFANQPQASAGVGHFEIVSLSGTVSMHGSHLHLAIADEGGRTIGGHLMDRCIVYTTAEIVLAESPRLVFRRAKDGSTPWEELQVETR